MKLRRLSGPFSRSAREGAGLVGIDWKPLVEIDPKYYRPAEVDLLVGDATKAKKQLNWQPKVNFKQLVKMMVEADLELAEREAFERDRKVKKLARGAER